ncbi:MAG TPA: asparaginase [Acidimicrobiales bacterium]|nr:asparaginase [Acidimicrobiales bacterium]
MEEPVLVEVVRSGLVESRHRGSVVALRADGSTALAHGDVENPVYGRSANKPMQAVAMVELGLDLPAELLALVCASHNGEPMHVEGVRRILVSAGLDEGALCNTRDLPIHQTSAREVIRAGGGPASILQNCSGKHAGMLATCVVNDWPTEGYLHPDHPLQEHITGAVEALAEEPVRHIGIDGCGAPAHALSLTGLARAFATIAAAPTGTPMGAVATSMTAHPAMVGGTGREVTELMVGVPGLMAKDGAEGVLAAGCADGRAAALKLSDGSWRGFAAVLLGALDHLGVDSAGASALRTRSVLGGGQPVGEAHAVVF